MDQLTLAALVGTASLWIVARWLGGDGPGANRAIALSTFLMGFVHFAVGHIFFFRSTRFRDRLRARRRVVLAAIGGSLGVGALGFFPLLTPVTLAFVYMHFVENALYHGCRMSYGEDRVGLQSAILPYLILFAGIRIFPELRWTSSLALPAWIPVGQAAAMVVCLIGTAYLVRTNSARAVLQFAARSPITVAVLLAFTLACPAGALAFHFFTLWHFLMWFGFVWADRPEARGSLIGWHAVCLGAFGALFWAAYAGRSMLPGYANLFLISPLAYQAQSLFHTSLTFVFRRYE